MLTILALLVATSFLLWLIFTTFVNRSSREANIHKLNVEPASSYEQKTNHLPATKVDMGPIPGIESPFRVNLYQAYIE